MKNTNSPHGETRPSAAQSVVACLAEDMAMVNDIIETHRGSQGELIAILEEIQTACGYLPEEALRRVAEATGRSLVDVFGVATFYRSFSLRPRGKHHACVCLGTACHVRGAARVVKEIEQELGIPVGETTPDGEFSLETVNCLGACALGPVTVIDGNYVSKVKTSDVRQMLEKARRNGSCAEAGRSKSVLPLDVSCALCRQSLMDEDVALDAYPSIRVTASANGHCGWLRLSSVYGSTRIASEHEIPFGALARFQCPHCQADLAGLLHCPACDAPMVSLALAGGGALRVCSRRGCSTQSLDAG